MIQIAHPFIWFAQVIVAVVCIGIALVVCETGEKSPKEATLEHKETPAGKDETSAKKARGPADDDTDEDCSESCEKEYSACLDRIKSSSMKFFFSNRCGYTRSDCKGACSMPAVRYLTGP